MSNEELKFEYGKSYKVIDWSCPPSEDFDVDVGDTVTLSEDSYLIDEYNDVCNLNGNHILFTSKELQKGWVVEVKPNPVNIPQIPYNLLDASEKLKLFDNLLEGNEVWVNTKGMQPYKIGAFTSEDTAIYSLVSPKVGTLLKELEQLESQKEDLETKIKELQEKINV